MNKHGRQTSGMNTTPHLMEGGTAVCRDLFSPAQLDTLERQCDALTLEQARLTGNGASSIRTTKVAWVTRDAQTEDHESAESSSRLAFFSPEEKPLGRRPGTEDWNPKSTWCAGHEQDLHFANRARNGIMP